MVIARYEDMNSMEIDVIREIGSIGTGNAVSALSSLMNVPVHMSVPNIRIYDYNEAIAEIGDPEDIIASVLVTMSGEIRGIMMIILDNRAVKEIASSIIGQEINSLSEIDEMTESLLTEVGNIMISSYVNAISGLADIDIKLSVPAIAINMLGAILGVPMAELGYETDKLMMIDGSMKIKDNTFNNTILMLPNIESLNTLMRKLMGEYGQ